MTQNKSDTATVSGQKPAPPKLPTPPPVRFVKDEKPKPKPKR